MARSSPQADESRAFPLAWLERGAAAQQRQVSAFFQSATALLDINYRWRARAPGAPASVRREINSSLLR
jgi:hypothetical protein